MINRGHTTEQAAWAEALKNNFWPCQRGDGLLVVSNGKTRLALQREHRARSTQWHWVTDFPPDVKRTGE